MNDASLRGANLTNTRLTGARMDNASWLDGTKCKEGSVGECRQ